MKKYRQINIDQFLSVHLENKQFNTQKQIIIIFTDDIKKRDATSPSAPSETSTNVPSDDDGQEFLNEWDEWSEHEVGNGPRAHWEDVHYDFNTGKVTAPA